MRSVALILFLSFLATFSTSAQQPAATQPTGSNSHDFLFRVQRFDQNVSDCIVLRPDGHYRREHWVETVEFTKAIVMPNERFEKHVFEGQLTPEEVDTVRTIIDQPTFRALHSPEKQHMSPESLEGLVLRPGEPKQQFLLSLSADYKPNKAALKPLFAWIRVMERKKHDVSKSEANKCRVEAVEMSSHR